MVDYWHPAGNWECWPSRPLVDATLDAMWAERDAVAAVGVSHVAGD